jgi:hypothetical protein
MQKMQDDQRTFLGRLASDVSLRQQIQRLHQLTVYGRWTFVAALWLTIGALSIWQFRFRIQLLMDYFTWSAVKYGLFYHQISAFGLFVCLGITGAVLAWQIRNVLFGLPKSEQFRLQQQILRIRQQGSTHPLWRWVCREEQEF